MHSSSAPQPFAPTEQDITDEKHNASNSASATSTSTDIEAASPTSPEMPDAPLWLRIIGYTIAFLILAAFAIGIAVLIAYIICAITAYITPHINSVYEQSARAIAASKRVAAGQLLMMPLPKPLYRIAGQ
jgi:hypothetical protein